MRRFLPVVAFFALWTISSYCYGDEEEVRFFLPLVTKETIPETKLEIGIEHTREPGHETELE